MFRQGAPEKVIQERTGHRSVEALRSYERLDDMQHKAVSSLLSNASGNSRSMTYDQHLMSIKNHSFNMSCTSYAAPPIPSINLQDLHGCTINFNYAPATTPTSSQPALMQDARATYTEAELKVVSQAD